MPLPIVFAAPIILAAVLVASGLGSLVRGRGSATDWADLGVPAALRQPWMLTAHPWAELLLAGALLVTGGPLAWAVRAMALLLMVAYLLLVLRAVRRPVPVPCNCFGADPEQVVTWRTVWRNAWLVGVALVGLLSLLTFDLSIWSWLVESGTTMWWVIALAAAALTTALVLDGSGRAPGRHAANGTSAATTAAESQGHDDLDYLRQPTPAIPLTLADGSTRTLRELTAMRALLVLHVSETCASCTRIVEQLDSIRGRLPGLDVRLLIAGMPVEESSLASTEEPQTLHDEYAWIPQTFGYTQYPTAILLGADGLTAGGPVIGGAAVEGFIDEVEASLAQGHADAEL